MYINSHPFSTSFIYAVPQYWTPVTVKYRDASEHVKQTYTGDLSSARRQVNSGAEGGGREKEDVEGHEDSQSLEATLGSSPRPKKSVRLP